MNLQLFMRYFPSERSCSSHFVDFRIKNGMCCPRCSHKRHYWLPKKLLFQCKCCGHRMSLRSGTPLKDSKLPIWYWYVGIYIIITESEPLSVKELKQAIGHKRYEPIWLMATKIRSQVAPLTLDATWVPATHDPVQVIEYFLSNSGTAEFQNPRRMLSSMER